MVQSMMKLVIQHIYQGIISADKRRFRKLDLLNGAHFELENSDSGIYIMPWGVQKALLESFERLIQIK